MDKATPLTNKNTRLRAANSCFLRKRKEKANKAKRMPSASWTNLFPALGAS